MIIIIKRFIDIIFIKNKAIKRKGNLALKAMEIQAGPGAKNIQQYQTGVAGGGGGRRGRGGGSSGPPRGAVDVQALWLATPSTEVSAKATLGAASLSSSVSAYTAGLGYAC